MPTFTPQEKAGLSFILQEFLEADEPEAMLTVLRHVAERKAMSVLRLRRVEESRRWMALANALRAAEQTLKKAA